MLFVANYCLKTKNCQKSLDRKQLANFTLASCCQRFLLLLPSELLIEKLQDHLLFNDKVGAALGWSGQGGAVRGRWGGFGRRVDARGGMSVARNAPD